MLYRCDCKAFDIESNDYRKFCLALAIYYTQYFLFTNPEMKRIVILLFEPGGLLDEATIVEEILAYIKTMQYEFTIVIYIIEPYKEYNEQLLTAQKYFYNTFISYPEVSIYYCENTVELKKILRLSSIDYLLFLNLDPYEYIYFDYYKNEKEDILMILKNTCCFLDILLCTISSYFYDIELTFLIFNKKQSENSFIKYRLFGKNNMIQYVIQSINYFYE